MGSEEVGLEEQASSAELAEVGLVLALAVAELAVLGCVEAGAGAGQLRSQHLLEQG
jgi:hypothetical protein